MPLYFRPCRVVNIDRSARRRDLADQLAGLPARAWQDRPLDHAVAVALDDPENRGDQLLAEVMRLETEIVELRVGGVVVVLFELDPGVGELADLDFAAG